MMRVSLGLGAAAGLLATLYFGARFADFSASPNGGLAALALLGPLGSSMLFTAVCVAGVGVTGQLEELRRYLEAGRADQRKMLDLMAQLVAQTAANVPLPVAPDAVQVAPRATHWVNPKYAPGRSVAAEGVPELEPKAENALPAPPRTGKSWPQVKNGPDRQEPKL